MSQSTTCRARMDSSLKQKAERILKQLGLTPSDSIRLLYQQIVLQKGLPFDVKIPNATTMEAILDEDKTKHNSIEAMKEHIENE